jgi:hypothetical protein
VITKSAASIASQLLVRERCGGRREQPTAIRQLGRLLGESTGPLARPFTGGSFGVASERDRPRAAVFGKRALPEHPNRPQRATHATAATVFGNPFRTATIDRPIPTGARQAGGSRSHPRP